VAFARIPLQTLSIDHDDVGLISSKSSCDLRARALRCACLMRKYAGARTDLFGRLSPAWSATYRDRRYWNRAFKSAMPLPMSSAPNAPCASPLSTVSAALIAASAAAARTSAAA
jgi:hypothetical protein